MPSQNKAKIAYRALNVYRLFSRRELHQNASKSIFLEIYGLRMDLGWVLCIFEGASGREFLTQILQIASLFGLSSGPGCSSGWVEFIRMLSLSTSTLVWERTALSRTH